MCWYMCVCERVCGVIDCPCYTYINTGNSGNNLFGIYRLTAGRERNMTHVEACATSSNSFSPTSTTGTCLKHSPHHPHLSDFSYAILYPQQQHTLWSQITTETQIISITQIHEEQIISCPRGPSHLSLPTSTTKSC